MKKFRLCKLVIVNIQLLLQYVASPFVIKISVSINVVLEVRKWRMTSAKITRRLLYFVLLSPHFGDMLGNLAAYFFDVHMPDENALELYQIYYHKCEMSVALITNSFIISGTYIP
jgi:hypothetical protein